LGVERAEACGAERAKRRTIASSTCSDLCSQCKFNGCPFIGDFYVLAPTATHFYREYCRGCLFGELGLERLFEVKQTVFVLIVLSNYVVWFMVATFFFHLFLESKNESSSRRLTSVTPRSGMETSTGLRKDKLDMIGSKCPASTDCSEDVCK
jgi:hypothetical protein